MRYTEQDVERVAEAICNADTASWKNTDDTQTLPDVTWAEMRDGTDHIPYEGISLGRDHYRGMARAALEAMEREPVTAEQVQAYCKKRGLVMMTKNIAEHLTRQAR